MGRVRILLERVGCFNPEDVMPLDDPADEFYIVAGAMAIDGVGGDPIAQSTITVPVTLHWGSWHTFPPDQAVIFDHAVPNDATVYCHMNAYNDATPKDWVNRRQWVDEVTAGLATAGVAVLASGMVLTPIGWIALIGAGVAGALHIMAPTDADDLLGTTSFRVNVMSGQATETHEWPMVQILTLWWKQWLYRVSYRIHRSGGLVPE